MNDTELLATLVGARAAMPLTDLMAAHGNLRQLATVHPADLRDAGLTDSAIKRVKMIFELARRHGEVEWVPGEPFRGSYDVFAHFRERLAAEPVEHFLAVLLDNKHRKIRDVEVAQGSLTSTVVHPRDVFSRIIRKSAAAVIFIHNHPSGDATPSREDLEITRRLRDVGELIGVRILDHIIIGRGGFVSFVDDGYW